MKNLIGLGLGVLVIVGIGVAYVYLQDPVTRENYDKVESGMTEAQVVDILGKGNEQAGVGVDVPGFKASTKTITWGDEEKSITITFVNDEVVTKVHEGL